MRFVLGVLVFQFLLSIELQGQDLLQDLKSGAAPDPGYVSSIFKSTRIINSHSVQTVKKGNLDFRISHRFGQLNSGAYNFFGLDQASIRLGLEYGLTDKITVGLGRSSYQKTIDGYFKTNLVKQQKSFPFSITWFSNMAIVTLREDDPQLNSRGSYRYSYAHQLILARKFTNFFSGQIAPILVHTNLSETNQSNDTYAIEGGGAFSLSKRVSFNVDYIYRLPGGQLVQYNNSLSVGVDIETGGHVFQLHVTNSQGMIEEKFVSQTQGVWSNGDLFYGFNISRQFGLRDKSRRKTSGS